MKRGRNRVWAVAAALCVSAGAALAQQTECSSAPIPVSAFHRNFEIASGLRPHDLIASGAASPAAAAYAITPFTISSLAFDDGPRRIAIVLDDDLGLDPAARRAEVRAVSHLLHLARPADSFALVAVRGGRRSIDFTRNRDRLWNGVAVAMARVSETVPLNLPEGIDEALGMFGQAQAGDAVVVVAPELYADERAAYATRSSNTLERALQGGVRVFIMNFGVMNLSAEAANQDGALAALADATGGYRHELAIAPASLAPWLSDDGMPQLFRVISQVYFAVLQGGPRSLLAWSLRPNDALLADRDLTLLYPREVTANCAAIAAAAPE